jgi:hypothetical protein
MANRDQYTSEHIRHGQHNPEGAPDRHRTRKEAHLTTHELEDEQTDAKREKEREAAQLEALDIAPTIDEVKHPHQQEPEIPQRQGPITKKQLDQEFNRTMKYIQEEMSPSKRAFSRMIHTNAIEKTSDFLGSTFARPNALLAGSVGAFALTLSVYIFAKTVGYPLSGFETIGSFIVGWLLGSLYDYLAVMITGKR